MKPICAAEGGGGGPVADKHYSIRWLAKYAVVGAYTRFAFVTFHVQGLLW